MRCYQEALTIFINYGYQIIYTYVLISNLIFLDDDAILISVLTATNITCWNHKSQWSVDALRSLSAWTYMVNDKSSMALAVGTVK
jgi:hypothetical protein